MLLTGMRVIADESSVDILRYLGPGARINMPTSLNVRTKRRMNANTEYRNAGYLRLFCDMQQEMISYSVSGEEDRWWAGEREVVLFGLIE